MNYDATLKLILANQVRLFWLITQAQGVARYASDVEQFTRVEVMIGEEDEGTALKTINGYRIRENLPLLESLK